MVMNPKSRPSQLCADSTGGLYARHDDKRISTGKTNLVTRWRHFDNGDPRRCQCVCSQRVV
jgi:hypothetical protein